MPDPIVSPEWLADHLDDPDVHPVDVREEWEYDALGHVPGAANVPFDSFRDEGGPDPGMLPGPESFAEQLGEAGLSRSDALVAYDDTNGVFAARFVLTALVYGFDDVHLLNGDLSTWRRRHEVDAEPTTRHPVDVPPRRVEGSNSPIVDAAYVRERIAAADGAAPSDDGGDGTGPRSDADTNAADGVVLIDTRTQSEYDAGRLPHAIRFDWTEAVDPDTRGVKPREELRTLFAERGITPDREIILYCNTARRLSHTYVVLRWLGFDAVRIYEGSLTEWGRIGGELVTSTDE